MTEENVLQAVQATVDQCMERVVAPVVVDAGCGSATHVTLPEDARIIGVDLSMAQLARHAGLHRAICANLETVDLSECRARLVVCWNVLEHLSRPVCALDNLAAALEDGGLLIVACPNPNSAKGLVTKATPHWVHVWFYRSILGRKDAGQNDSAPFRTYMRRSISTAAIVKWATEAGLESALTLEYEGYMQRRMAAHGGAAYRAYWFLGRLVEFVSIGTIPYRATELIVVLRRPVK